MIVTIKTSERARVSLLAVPGAHYQFMFEVHDRSTGKQAMVPFNNEALSASLGEGFLLNGLQYLPDEFQIVESDSSQCTGWYRVAHTQSGRQSSLFSYNGCIDVIATQCAGIALGSFMCEE